MATVLFEYSNYPLLRCALVFFFFVIICFLLHYQLRDRRFWKWIGFFGVLQGIQELSLISTSVFMPVPFSEGLRLILTGLSFFVFARVLCRQLGWRDDRPGLLLSFLILFVLATTGFFWDGVPGILSLISIALVLLSGTVAILWFALKGDLRFGQRMLSGASLVFIFLYVLTHLLDEAVFFQRIGFPIHILRASLIGIATLILWFYHDRVFKKRISEGTRNFLLRWERAFLFSLGAVLVVGWVFTSWAGKDTENQQKNDLLNVARIAAASVDPENVVALEGSEKDWGTTEYLRLREQQLQIGSAARSHRWIRWFYQMVMRDGKIIFTADSILETDPDHSPPGDVYEDAPQGLYQVFSDGEERIVGPYHDQWGTFVSAFVPIRSFHTGEVVGVQGVDVNLSIIVLRSWEVKIFVISIMMLAVILMTGIFLWQVRIRQDEDALRSAFDHLQRTKEDLERADALRAQIETHMADLVEAIPNPIYFKDEQKVYRSCNQAFVDYLGLPKEKIIGARVHDVATRELAAQHDHQDDILLREGGRLQYEGQVFRADGTYKDIVFYKSAMLHPDGTPRGIVGVMLDITDRKRVERDIVQHEASLIRALDDLKKINVELEKTQGQLVQSEKLAAIGVLSAGIAHEINNPLGFIQGNIGVLAQYVQVFLEVMAEYEKLRMAVDGADVGRLKELKSSIEQMRERSGVAIFIDDVSGLLKDTQYGVTRIKKIISSLQNFSYASHGEKKRFNVNDVIEGIISIVWNEVKYKAELLKEYGEGLFVEADEQQLGQVFINIIVNAAHSIDGRGVIRLKTFVQQDHVVVEISDTGRGISKDVMPKIFDPFFTTKEPGKGTGLGLSISYDIIKKHNGKILVDSELGKGTVFRVFLPLAKGL